MLVPHAPDLEAMLAAADGALVIGDPALFADHRAIGAEKIDLGLAWSEMTGLPFVWAFWAGRPDAASPEVVTALQDAARSGLMHLDDIADAHSTNPVHQAIGRRYLRDSLMFQLNDRALDGLRAYYREALALGVATGDPNLTFFGADASVGSRS